MSYAMWMMANIRIGDTECRLTSRMYAIIKNEVGLSRKGVKRSEECVEKMRKGALGKSASIETRRLMSQNSTSHLRKKFGKDNPRYGAILSNETKNKIGSANSRIVLDKVTGEKFIGVGKAAKSIGFTRSRLQAMLIGQSKNTTNFM